MTTEQETNREEAMKFLLRTRELEEQGKYHEAAQCYEKAGNLYRSSDKNAMMIAFDFARKRYETAGSENDAMRMKLNRATSGAILFEGHNIDREFSQGLLKKLRETK